MPRVQTRKAVRSKVHATLQPRIESSMGLDSSQGADLVTHGLGGCRGSGLRFGGWERGGGNMSCTETQHERSLAKMPVLQRKEDNPVLFRFWMHWFTLVCERSTNCRSSADLPDPSRNPELAPAPTIATCCTTSRSSTTATRRATGCPRHAAGSSLLGT